MERCIARRSTSVPVFTVILWFFALVFIGALRKVDLSYIALATALTISAVFYTVVWIITPNLLIERAEDGIVVHRRGSSEKIRYDEIKYISTSRYSGRGISYSYGKLEITLRTGEIIKVRWVADVESVRRRLEDLREMAKEAQI